MAEHFASGFSRSKNPVESVEDSERKLEYADEGQKKKGAGEYRHTPGRVVTGGARERKIEHRRVSEAGVITYKKKPSSELKQAIQLGIGQCVSVHSSAPERDLLMQDFAMVEVTTFPGVGSYSTPAHRCSDFSFKTYAPMAFRYFRGLFGIKAEEFMVSMCVEPLRELTNSGASGSLFYCSPDDEFIVKTVQRVETEFLQKLLPGYFLNISQHKRTLLPKFYGLYCYMSGNKKIRFTIMNNLLPSTVAPHEKYDLKGSTYKRKASKTERLKKNPTLKDLDFMAGHPGGLLLHPNTWEALMRTLHRDCRVLESFKIMDYSLLVGVYNLDQPLRDQREEGGKKSELSNTQAAGSTGGKEQRRKSVLYSTPMESIYASEQQLDSVHRHWEHHLPPGGIPAKNAKGEQLLLYLGIIDILQAYRLAKRMEHAAKAVLIERDTISVHKPKFYASRFLDFVSTRVFVKDPQARKTLPRILMGGVVRPDLVRDTHNSSSKPSVDRSSVPRTHSPLVNMDIPHKTTFPAIYPSQYTKQVHAPNPRRYALLPYATPHKLPSPTLSSSIPRRHSLPVRRTSLLPLLGNQPMAAGILNLCSQLPTLAEESDVVPTRKVSTHGQQSQRRPSQRRHSRFQAPI